MYDSIDDESKVVMVSERDLSLLLDSEVNNEKVKKNI